MRHLDVSDTGMTAAICGRGAVFCLYIDNRLPVKARAIVFSIIVPKHANTTTDNEYMTGKQTYEYYNGFIWQGRYAHCISPEETIERMKR